MKHVTFCTAFGQRDSSPNPGKDLLSVQELRRVDDAVNHGEEMKEWVAQHQPKLLVMCGAGDIDTLLQPVKQLLEGNNAN